MPPAAAREEQDMETITNLIKDTPIPKMVKVRQNFDKTCIPGLFHLLCVHFRAGVDRRPGDSPVSLLIFYKRSNYPCVTQ